MNPAPIEIVRLRPGELVLDYLDRNIFAKANGAPTRLPTIDDIAIRLNVSNSTVRGVFRRLAAEGRLQTVPGRGTFLRNPEPAATAPLILATNIGSFDQTRDPNWAESICLGAMRLTGRFERRISIMPVEEGANLETGKRSSSDSPQDQLLQMIDHIDLVMLFPAPGREKIRRAFEEAGKPAVDINPPFMSATSNFVSTHFFEAGFRMGRAWYKSGRREILFVSTPGWELSVSIQLLVSGMSIGCRRDLDSSVRFRFVMASASAEEAEQGVAEVLRSGAPHAIFCLGDAQGLGALQAMRDAGLNAPTDISVIAGTGLASTRERHPELTVILQPMDQIGANAVRILHHRSQNQCAPVPGLFLSPSFGAGTTTSSQENKLLSQPLPDYLV